MAPSTLSQRLASGALDEKLTYLYGPKRLARERDRYAYVLERFDTAFGRPAEAFFTAPGRTELGGNHTDHQHGRVLAAGVDMDILAAAVPTGSGKVRFLSEGYSMVEISLSELDPVPGERNTTAALLRGVAARFDQLGCDLSGAGFDAYAVSDVPGGSGLSSSAAFEVLAGNIFNDLYFNNKCTPVELAQIGQYAENFFFGKPCGLMDQTASSVGGVVAIDFKDPAHPVVEQIDLDLHKAGYALCILDSRAGHEDLTAEYAAITDELKTVSRHFGKEVLREVSEEEFSSAIPALRKEAGDRAVLRSMHYFDENERAHAQAEALKAGDFDGFLKLASASGRSSALYLQNVVPTGQTANQELMLTIALASHILNGRGAVRVHGGGFGGTAQAFVPLDMADQFKARIEAVLGEGACHILNVRPVGGMKLS